MKLSPRRVPGVGNPDAELLLIGEAPGKYEDRTGIPFVGDAGRELDRFLHYAHINRDDCWITNVLKYRPLEPDNRDPTPEEIEEAWPALLLEVEQVRPRVIATLGRISTNLFVDGALEKLHGIPHRVNLEERFGGLFGVGEVVVVPVFHPAYGIHSPSMQNHIQWDVMQVGKALREPFSEVSPVEDYYSLVADDAESAFDKFPSDVYWLMAVDTESVGSNLWGLSFSVRNGDAHVLKTAQKMYGLWGKFIERTEPTVLLHNSLHDLTVLREMGIDLIALGIPFIDTMIMAYHLGVEPQGLKPLAYRHCRMEMQSYSEVIGTAAQARALLYLEEVNATAWPDAEEELVFDPKTGEPRIRKPWSLNKKVKRLLSDFSKGKDPDLIERWNKKDNKHYRKMAEAELGAMPPATLDDVPEDVAIHYSARDADATFQLYPKLKERHDALDLQAVLDLDMGVVPMVERMKCIGMPADRDYFIDLSKFFQGEMERVDNEIYKHAGRVVNAESFKQVAELLFDKLKIQSNKLTKSKLSKSTDNKVLESLRSKHPVVPLVIEHRELNKLKGTYCDVLPEKITDEGRLRPDYMLTRVPTGRLACKEPNLMAIPVRTKVGKRIREGFRVDREDRVLMASDLSQIEVRFTAHESQDEHLCRLLIAGEDIHTVTTCHIFGIPEKEFDRENDEHDRKRLVSKNVTFGVIYGIGPGGLLAQLEQRNIMGWTEEDCANMIEEWFKLYPGVREDIARRRQEGRRYGYVRDWGGRLTYHAGLRSTVPRVRALAERQVYNYGIQGGAQAFIKKAMKNIWVTEMPILQSLGYFEPLLQVHDELIFELDKALMPIAEQLIGDAMCNAGRLRVPVETSCHFGSTWGELK